MNGKVKELIKRMNFVSNSFENMLDKGETTFLEARWALMHLTPEEIEALARFVRNTRLFDPLSNLDLCPVLASIDSDLAEMLEGAPELKNRRVPSDDEAYPAGKILLTALYRAHTNPVQPLDLYQQHYKHGDKSLPSLTKTEIDEGVL